MAKKMKKPKPVKKAKPLKVRKVALKSKQAVRIIVDGKALPVVAHAAPNVVEVVALERPVTQKATKPIGWLEYLFGVPR